MSSAVEHASSEFDEMEDDLGAPVVIPSNVNRGRRVSVSAESMNPSSSNDYKRIVIPKSAEQRSRIQNAVQNNFLFKNLDEDQYKEVVDAMAEKKVTSGEDVITQGAVGDFFYVVETGQLDVYIQKKDEKPVKVTSYGPGGSFGELALMYNAPRAATVRGSTDGVLWALDRVTFRRILMDSTSRKRKMYESFLEEVPLLAALETYERHKIADALESITYSDGDVVIKQGDEGDAFYIVESGEAIITQVDESGVDHVIGEAKKGSYFGELALLSNKPRAATVTAKGKLKCAHLGKKAFDRLLGPALDIIKRNTAQYKALTRRKSIQGKKEKYSN
jgi:CRP-like cAMP-binding protein